MAACRVALEVGKSWVFASALEWPGWCRRGKGESAALAALTDYRSRYQQVLGTSFAPGSLEIVGRVAAGIGPEFGVPDKRGAWDQEPADLAELDRLTAVLEACWAALDRAVAAAPAVLAKGPRGGGRDRDQIAEHVREGERSYSRKLGLKLPPRTPWAEQREQVAAALRQGAPEGSWPVRYGIRRAAWHVLDHAWEIEDKSG